MRVYVDGDNLYCVDCHESTEELIPVEVITVEERDGASTTRLRCINGDHAASPDEIEHHRLPIPDPEYAHHALLESDYLPGRSQERDELPPCFSSRLLSPEIAVFFPSVYTHAIPWAIHTKEIAKKHRRDKGYYGNVLDERSRNMQRGETLGIPIGPATSNILSELLLHPVDAALRDDKYTFIRFIDDYWCYCISRSEADAFIVALEDQLAEYGLQLNASKTSITPLPATTNDPWVIQLRTQLDAINLSQSSTLGNLFDLATSLQAKWPSQNVVKYAARALARHATSDDLRQRCTRHILEIAFHYPSVMPILARLVQKDPSAVRADELEHLLRRQSQERAPTDAVCWTLFAWREQTPGTKTLPPDLAEAVIETNDCMAIASLWAIEQAEDAVIAFVRKKLAGSTDEEYDRYWLLVHEVGDKAPETQSYRERTGLQLLADEEVSFIDRSTFTGNDDEPM